MSETRRGETHLGDPKLFGRETCCPERVILGLPPVVVGHEFYLSALGDFFFGKVFSDLATLAIRAGNSV